MYKQPTSDEYDLALLIAKRDLAGRGTELEDEGEHSGGEFITKDDFFESLRKACSPIKPKSVPKPSKT